MRAVVVLTALALAGPARAQHVPSAPPPDRTFGPDRTAVGVFTGQGITKPGLTCDAPAAPAARTCTGFLASGADGTLLEVVVRLPATAGAHPLVVAMHGWGGGQGSMSKYDDPLTQAGYAVLRYSARGFGASWGQTNFADLFVEGVDLRSMIAQVVDLYPSAVDGKAVAVFGASYGGAHAWLGALVPEFTTRAGRPVSVKTVIPVATWSDALNGLAPNGRPDQAQDPTGAQKLSFVEGLFAGGIRTRADRPYPNYPDYLVVWDGQMLVSEAPYSATPTGRQLVDGLQGYRSIYWQRPFWERVRQRQAAGLPQLPILAVQGWTDDLFPPVEALRMYDALRSIDPKYPIALHLGDLGHPRAANKQGELDYALGEVLDWLGWYLKGQGSAPALDVRAAITRPHDVPFSPDDVIRVPSYDKLATSTASHTFSGWKAITFDPLNVTGFKWDPLVMVGCEQLQPCPTPPAQSPVPGDVATYELAAKDVAGGKAFLVAGEPSVVVHAASLAPRVQLDVRLIDVAPGGSQQLVTRGTVTIDSLSKASLGMHRVRIAGFGNLWEVAPDHVLRLEVTNVDTPYLRPSLVPSATAISDVTLSIPIRDAPPHAAPAVAAAPAQQPAPATAAPATAASALPAAAANAVPAATAVPAAAANAASSLTTALPNAVQGAVSTATGALGNAAATVTNALPAVTNALPAAASAVQGVTSALPAAPAPAPSPATAPVPNAAPAVSAAPTPTANAIPTATPTPTPTSTPTATSTPTSTSTATSTPTPTSTATPTATPTPTSTATSTAAPIAAPTPTAAPTATATPTATPTALPTPAAAPPAAPAPAPIPAAPPVPSAPPVAAVPAPVATSTPTATAAPASP